MQFISIILLCSFGVPQIGPPPSRFEPATAHLPGELSFAQACQKASAFMNKLDQTATEFPIEKCRIRRTVLRSFYKLGSKEGGAFNVELRGGDVLLYVDYKRRSDQFKGIGRTGQNFFASEAQAKNYIRALATRLGMPTSAVPYSFGWERDGNTKERGAAGGIWSRYQTQSARYGFEIDPQDGRLVYYSFIRRG